MIKGIHHVSIKCIKEDYEKAKSFYTDVLGLKLLRQWPDGAMLEIGGDIVEIFNNGTERLPKGVITHIAFSTDNPDELAKRVAFCYGPLGEEIEFFAERKTKS